MIIPFILDKALSLYADKEAVVYGEKRFTYREFADRIYRLANFLGSRRIEKGGCVAIMHHNSHEFLESYFAVAQLGAILNPLNVRLSPKELAFILKDSGASLLIASGRFCESIGSLLKIETGLDQIIWTGRWDKPASVESFDYEDSLGGEGTTPPPMPEIYDEDVAHLYYTSGTTGRPKGVMLSHKNVCIHALAAIAELKLGDYDNWIHVAPLFHLADAWATFAITWAGGKHVAVPDFDPTSVLLPCKMNGPPSQI